MPRRRVVDPAYRHAASQAHSATHLVHAALRQTLGQEAHQSGSYNKAGYMRLDFSLEPGAVAGDPQRDRGGRQQRRARQPRGRRPASCPSTRRSRRARWRCSARSTATPCGSSTSAARGRANSARAPTCARSAEVGLVNLVSESSVGSTNRRVEALVGLDAFRDLTAERAIVVQLTQP